MRLKPSSALPLAFAISPTSVPAFYRLRILLTPTFDKEPKKPNQKGFWILIAYNLAGEEEELSGSDLVDVVHHQGLEPWTP